jgi:hypothetical protein
MDQSVVGSQQTLICTIIGWKKRDKGKNGKMDSFLHLVGWKKMKEKGLERISFFGAHFNFLPILGGNERMRK